MPNIYMLHYRGDCPDYDTISEVVVIAKDEKEARKFVYEECDDTYAAYWVIPEITMCHHIGITATPNMKKGILVKDVHEG